jgi:BolA family transcriptional regulator, general stress-responsive regulator
MGDAPLTSQELAKRLTELFAPSALEVLDESAEHAGHAGSNGQGHGTHFRVRMASTQFEGKSRVACHRLVYDALKPQFERGLHALALELRL